MSSLLSLNEENASRIAHEAVDLDKAKKYGEAIEKYKEVVRIYHGLFSKTRADVDEQTRVEKLAVAEKYMSRIEKLKGMAETVEESTPPREIEFVTVRPSVRLADVIGNDEVKQHLRDQIVRRIQHPELFPLDETSGCLLYGPPGTGKTHIARCLAGETGHAFICVKSSDIDGRHVGESENNVKRLFEEARKRAPVIIFIDEADGLLTDRRKMEQHSHKASTLNEFLQQWDGFTKNSNIFVMGASNRPQDIDPAAMRRFKACFYVGLPTYADRLAMLRKMLPGVAHLEEIAERTEWFSGHDLKTLVSESQKMLRTELFRHCRFIVRDGKYHSTICMACYETTQPCSVCGSTYVPESDLAGKQLVLPEIRLDHLDACLASPSLHVVANPAMIREYEQWGLIDWR